MRKITRKGIIRKLDKLVSQIVINRDRACVVCGSTQSLTNGHLFSRVAYSTRWDLINSNCQCLSCNLRHEYDAYPYTKWFIKKYGQDRLDELHLQYTKPRKFKTFELIELYEEMKYNLDLYYEI